MPEALIWGASGGIGKAVVELLSKNQWRVFTAARNKERLSIPVYASYYFDASESESFREISRDLAFQTEGLDLVLYAAGSIEADLIRKMNVPGWSAVLDSNLNGAFLAATHSIPLLKEGGHMMFMGAYVDHLLLPKMGAYAAAKAGLEPLVHILRREQRKLRFSIVRPGAVDTAFWQNAPFSLPDGAKSPGEVAAAIVSHYDAGSTEDLNL